MRDGAVWASSVTMMRDEHGAPYAVEVVEAERWDGAFLRPPAPEEADVRVVRLAEPAIGTPDAPAVPRQLPGWLAVEQAGVRVRPARRRVAEPPAAYAVSEETSGRLWTASPYHRAPGPGLGEFLAAGAVAVRYPDPVPAERSRIIEVVGAFLAGRTGALGTASRLAGDALERWLRYAFDDPDRFADAILLTRIDDRSDAEAREVAATLHFLRDAVVDECSQAYRELTFDRAALIEQASPWRYLGGEPFEAAMAAVRAWRRRYRVAYEAHFRVVVEQVAEVRSQIAANRALAGALARLDAMEGLGTPAGGAALCAFEAAACELAAFPLVSDPAVACTTGVRLGVEPGQVMRARVAMRAVRAAFEVQRGRLAIRLAHLALAQPGVPALDRVLQAIAASDVDGLDRVLDDELASAIAALLAEGAETAL